MVFPQSGDLHNFSKMFFKSSIFTMTLQSFTSLVLVLSTNFSFFQQKTHLLLLLHEQDQVRYVVLLQIQEFFVVVPIQVQVQPLDLSQLLFVLVYADYL